MKFHDNPKSLFAQLDSAWAQYTSGFNELMDRLLASVESWRWATDDMFPSHPLFGQADTTRVGEPWRPFTRTWLRDDDPKANLRDGCQHGFDRKGRIVLARSQHWGRAAIWHRSGCDRLSIHESRKEAGRFRWGLPYEDRVPMTRFWHDGAGRIECQCDHTRHGDEHHWKFEWFHFEGKRCVESIRQSFEVMTEIPYFQQERSEDELRDSYRPLTGNELLHNLVEQRFSRRRVKYSYSPSGQLIKAEEFIDDGRPIEDLVFQKSPERPFEETIEALASKVAETVRKAATKRSPSKPYRGIALIYSAEHPHCGLPHEVAVLGHESPWPKKRFDFEAYPESLNVAFKRPVSKLLTEFCQQCHARFAVDDFEAENAAAVSVMKRIAEQLHQGLAASKHVSDGFAVLVIDDHGDVNGFGVPG